MPSGNSKKWFAGSLFILALAMMAPMARAADEDLGGLPPGSVAPSTALPSGDMLAQPPAQSMHLGVPEESKVPGIQGESTIQPVPENSTTPATGSANSACEEDCGSFCGTPLCSPPGRFWLRADALLWWTNGTHLPPLVTSNSTGNPAIIGQPGTQVVFGDNTYLNEARGGTRLTFGGWLDRCHRWGIEADWFSIAGQSVDYSNFSNGTPATGRPFFNVETNLADSEIVALNPDRSGTVSVHDGDTFDSAGFSLRYNLCCGGCDPCGDSGGCGLEDAVDCCNLNMNYCRTDFLVGYRRYSYRDGLTIQESLDDRRQGFGFHFDIEDNFTCHNDFNGVDLGLNTELRRGRWSLNILTKMAFGNNRQVTYINGTTVRSNLQNPPDPTFFPVGIYAGATNSGNFAKDTFVVIPQLGLELGYQVTNYTRAYLGYNILYWGNVMHAGDQIDRNIDPRNWAGVPAQQAAQALFFPQVQDRNSTFWAQGINLGLEVRF